MELRSNRIIVKKIPFPEAILFRRSRIKRPKEALLKNLAALSAFPSVFSVSSVVE